MKKTILAVVSFLALAGSASGHELMFDLPHRHNSHYYENLRYKEHKQNQLIWITTNRLPYYMRYGSGRGYGTYYNTYPASRTLRSSATRSSQ